MTKQVSLLAGDSPISLDYFAQGFVDHTVSGMLEALEGTSPIENLNLLIENDKVTIDLNGSPVPVNAFASKILRNTTLGMISTLNQSFRAI